MDTWARAAELASDAYIADVSMHAAGADGFTPVRADATRDAFVNTIGDVTADVMKHVTQPGAFWCSGVYSVAFVTAAAADLPMGPAALYSHVANVSDALPTPYPRQPSPALMMRTPSHVTRADQCPILGVRVPTAAYSIRTEEEKSQASLWGPFLHFLYTCVDRTPARYRQTPAEKWAAVISGFVPADLSLLLPRM